MEEERVLRMAAKEEYDMEKAYDLVSGDFLLDMLRRYAFKVKWWNRIQKYFSWPPSQFWWMGFLQATLDVLEGWGKGIQSLLLSLMVLEVLGGLLGKAIEIGMLEV